MVWVVWDAHSTTQTGVHNQVLMILTVFSSFSVGSLIVFINFFIFLKF